MENKELLKIDLCGRLPHGVCCQIIGSDEIVVLCAITSYSKLGFNKLYSTKALLSRPTEDAKPILYPLSSLTKEIVVKGYNEDKPFKIIHEINRLASLDKEISQSIEWDFSEDHFLINVQYFIGGWECSFVSDLLNKWHIDYRGLIERELAIDVNTLETNPYVK